MKRKLQEIELIAGEILSQFNQHQSTPIDVSSIAKGLGLEIHNHKLEDEISGVLVVQDKKGKIGVNSSHAEVRQRFTIAHEIGHFVLEHSRKGSIFIDLPSQHMRVNYFRDHNSSTGQFWQEREANAFAAALLMPGKLISQKLKNYSFDLTNPNGHNETGEDDDLDKLAKEFNVSSQAMAIRLSNLGFLRY